MHTKLSKVVKFFPILVMTLHGCSGGNGEIDSSQTGGGGVTQSTVSIAALSASPAALLPGQSTLLSVSASSSSSSGGTLQYYWHTTDGTLGTNNLSTTNWTAPNVAGTYHINVDVSDGAGSRRGVLSIAVAAVPVSLQISSVLPAEARTGETILVRGNGFGATQGANTVTINGVSAISISRWSGSEIELRVPTAATTGEVVAHVGGSDSTPGRLTVLWNNRNPANVAVGSGTNIQDAPVLISDGQGGAIVVWVDYRDGNADIYAQRLDSRGQTMWTSNGRAVCNAAGDQLSPRIVADGAGGAIIVWQDLRVGANFNIYAQRIDRDGNALWMANGEIVAGMASAQTGPRVVSDGANGAVIAWQDYRSCTNFDLYSQRLNGTGVPQWAAGGVPVVTATGNQINPQIVTDSAAGAIVVWEDHRSGTNFDIYAQRIDAAGAPQWTLDGVSISSAVDNQSAPQLVADGSGGVIVAWQDYRNGTHYDIYAQSVDSTDAVGWTINGVLVCNAANNQVAPQIVQTETDRYAVVWEDYRSGNADVYAQLINELGTVQWASNGVAVTTATGNQTLPRLIADTAQGIIVAWQDVRLIDNSGIYSQRLGPDGSGLWADDGVAISSAQGNQLAPTMVADDAGGAILVWEDHRSGNADIYAQGVSAGGLQ